MYDFVILYLIIYLFTLLLSLLPTYLLSYFLYLLTLLSLLTTCVCTYLLTYLLTYSFMPSILRNDTLKYCVNRLLTSMCVNGSLRRRRSPLVWGWRSRWCGNCDNRESLLAKPPAACSSTRCHVEVTACVKTPITIYRSIRIVKIQTYHIGVGAQSTLGEDICRKIYVWEINKMSEFYMIFARKIFSRILWRGQNCPVCLLCLWNLLLCPNLSYKTRRLTAHSGGARFWFLARDSMLSALSALYAIANPSVRLSVCHTGGLVENGWS